MGERYIIPDSYRTIKLNVDPLRSLLNSAPIEFTLEAIEGRSEIILPMPDGTFHSFKFWESSTMEPELQASSLR
ncbi:MAG: hypothetical protein U5J96_07605 [Ignavibacteriaceae bacterium]|nr:hypothetical protein [Ignavibacteriaceae bacterium]